MPARYPGPEITHHCLDDLPEDLGMEREPRSGGACANAVHAMAETTLHAPLLPWEATHDETLALTTIDANRQILARLAPCPRYGMA